MQLSNLEQTSPWLAFFLFLLLHAYFVCLSFTYIEDAKSRMQKKTKGNTSKEIQAKRIGHLTKWKKKKKRMIDG